MRRNNAIADRTLHAAPVAAAVIAAAHDLRAPLTRLRGRLETALSDTADVETLRAAVACGIADADALVSTFNALLDLARLEAKPSLRLDAVDAAEAVLGVCDLYAPVAEEKSIALSADAAPAARVLAEPRLLAQAIANLLDNAVKYTPPGGRIRVSVRRAAPWVEIRIADTGPGIPAADRGRARERFVRLDTARGAAGFGIGLSVVAAIADRLGGELTLADAEPGLAATLRFRAAP